MQISQMQSLSSTSIVERYLAFFAVRGHLELPGSPLVVPGSTTSFTIAGMQPLLPYLRGQETPPSKRLTTLQRCLRTVDVDAVGTNERKLTFFRQPPPAEAAAFTRGKEAGVLCLSGEVIPSATRYTHA
jgi:alanyl-tRNA synthetase